MPSSSAKSTIRPGWTQRRVPTQDRSVETVRSILDATAQVLTDLGVERVSTNKIAKQAGIAVGSIYQYFPNKEAVIDALLDDRMGRMRELISESLAELAAGSASVSLAVEPMIRAIVDFLSREPGLRPLLMSHFFVAERDVLGPIQEDALDLGRALLGRSADLRGVDLHVAIVVFTHVVGVFGALLADPDLSQDYRERAVAEVARMLTLWIEHTLGPPAV